ncbi:transcription factor mef2A-like [Condylostylus longicornis]|uniref:transcription factor mef2A-like n=1 Tax=Condylostylus longicornis TaxID=2530218 RepID=UPI00244E2281|nr:transcription factor mef2A-like [Condylostylus longicornis]
MSQAHLNEISNSGPNDSNEGYHHHSVNHMHNHHHHHHHSNVTPTTTTLELITPSSVNTNSANNSTCPCIHQYNHLHHRHINPLQQQQIQQQQQQQQQYHHQHTNNRIINIGTQGLLNGNSNIPVVDTIGGCNIINKGVCCGDILTPSSQNNIGDITGSCTHNIRNSLHSTHSNLDDLNENRQISGETHVAHVTQQQQEHQHQYQALDSTLEDDDDDNDIDNIDDICDCNKSSSNSNNCNQHQLQHHNNLHSDTNDSSSIGLVIGGNIVGNNKGGISDVDGSIIPSGSEDSQIINQKCIHHRKNRNKMQQRIITSRGKSVKKFSEDEKDCSSRIEVYSDATDSGVKVTDGCTSEEDQGPPLPPRPPPRSRNLHHHGNVKNQNLT